MPLYEYACRDCGHRFERLRKYEERLARQDCPKCGAPRATLALSMPAVVGAGGGTDASPMPRGNGGGCCGGGCGCH